MATGRIGVTPTLGVRWSKAPTGGTTALSGLDDSSVSLVYSVGYEQVYRNGVLLSRGNDYTATTGTTITLIDATITGDIIEVFAQQLVPLTDAISKGQFTAKGALLSATAASTPGVLAVGTNGQYLSADSTASTGLAWATVSSGGMTLISETVASSLSSLSFSSLGSYKQLMLMWSGIRHSATGSIFGIRFNNDSNSIYIAQGMGMITSASFPSAAPQGDQQDQLLTATTIAAAYPFGQSASLAGQYTDVSGFLLLDNPTSTTKAKNYSYSYGYYNNSTSKYNARQGTGYFDSTTAVTSIDIFRTGGSATFTNQGNSTIRLYGVN